MEHMNGIEPQPQLFNKICTIIGFVQINYQLSQTLSMKFFFRFEKKKSHTSYSIIIWIEELKGVKSDEKKAVSFLHSNEQLTDNVSLSQLPVHFLILLFLFPCDPNLHPKFSSQNSANQTFLRLLASVRLRKYLSNPTFKRSERSIKI